MATATLVERPQLQSSGLNEPLDVTDPSAGGPSPNNDAAMEPVLETPEATPGETVLRRIGSIPGVRRGKVLSIRRQLVKGTYDVEGRLERATARVLEDLSAV